MFNIQYNRKRKRRGDKSLLSFYYLYMKHLKESILTSIGQGDKYLKDELLRKWGLDPRKAVWGEDGRVEYKDDVDCFVCDDDIEELPIKFSHVEGRFDLRDCSKLKTLEGCPEVVDGYFSCTGCDRLETLKGGPKEVWGNYFCKWCERLKNFEGAPEMVYGGFSCSDCKNLSSLKGLPKTINGDIYIVNCKKRFTKEELKKYTTIKSSMRIML